MGDSFFPNTAALLLCPGVPCYVDRHTPIQDAFTKFTQGQAFIFTQISPEAADGTLLPPRFPDHIWTDLSDWMHTALFLHNFYFPDRAADLEEHDRKIRSALLTMMHWKLECDERRREYGQWDGQPGDHNPVKWLAKIADDLHRATQRLDDEGFNVHGEANPRHRVDHDDEGSSSSTDVDNTYRLWQESHSAIFGGVVEEARIGSTTICQFQRVRLSEALQDVRLHADYVLDTLRDFQEDVVGGRRGVRGVRGV